MTKETITLEEAKELERLGYEQNSEFVTAEVKNLEEPRYYSAFTRDELQAMIDEYPKYEVEDAFFTVKLEEDRHVITGTFEAQEAWDNREAPLSRLVNILINLKTNIEYLPSNLTYEELQYQEEKLDERTPYKGDDQDDYEDNQKAYQGLL